MTERDSHPEDNDRSEPDAVDGAVGDGDVPATDGPRPDETGPHGGADGPGVDALGPDETAVAAAFVADVGDDVAGLLASADLWAEPPSGLDDRVAAEIVADASDAVDMADAARTGDVAVGDGRWAAAADRLWSWRQVVLGGAAVLAVLFVGVTLLSAFGDDGDEEVFTLELVPTGRVVDAAGDVTVTTTDSGIRVDLDAPSLPEREGDLFYEGWLRTDDDLLVPIGTFGAGDGVVLWAGVDLDRVVGLSITLEEAAGADSADQASSGDVVLKVDFPRR
jgi:hypothetical protein